MFLEGKVFRLEGRVKQLQSDVDTLLDLVVKLERRLEQEADYRDEQRDRGLE